MSTTEHPVAWAKRILDEGCLFFDTETTGLDTEAEIIHIAFVDQTGTKVLEEYVKPTVPIDETGEAFFYNRITNERVANCPQWPVVWNRVNDLWEPYSGKSSPLIAYNMPFDYRMLVQSCRRHGLIPPTASKSKMPLTCAMEMFARFWGTMDRKAKKRYSLADACLLCGVKDLPDHSALRDCIAMLRLVQYMAAQEGHSARMSAPGVFFVPGTVKDTGAALELQAGITPKK